MLICAPWAKWAVFWVSGDRPVFACRPTAAPKQRSDTMSVSAEQQEDVIRPLRSDLPLLACDAAFELDNLILGRPTGLESVKRLRETLAELLTDYSGPSCPSSLFNPTMALALNNAISDARQQEPVRRLAELMDHAKQYAGQLERLVASHHSKFEEKELKELRTFCLALSKRAFAFRSRRPRTPKHPFRR
jgi:hypothetical protein